MSEFHTHFKHRAPRQVIISKLMNTKEIPNERLENFPQIFKKIWSIIKDPLLEAHVKAIFIHNIHFELRFIAMDYVDFLFSKIVHKLIQKEKYMVEMVKLKYDNPPKDQKKPYPKKEYRCV